MGILLITYTFNDTFFPYSAYFHTKNIETKKGRKRVEERNSIPDSLAGVASYFPFVFGRNVENYRS